MASLQRRKDLAHEKLMEAATEEAGDDYSRKRAWDWTAEESAAWDKKLAKKKSHRDNNAFQSFGQDANKIYKRQVREMKPDTEGYERDKMAAIERAAASGGLEIVETEEGELIAVDRDGSFYSTKDSTEFVGNKPSKDAIDKLVGEIRKAEEVRLKKRKERGNREEEGDVTYINEKNKQVSLPSLTQSLSMGLLTIFKTVQHEARKILQQIHCRYPRELRTWHCYLRCSALLGSPSDYYSYNETSHDTPFPDSDTSDFLLFVNAHSMQPSGREEKISLEGFQGVAQSTKTLNSMLGVQQNCDDW